MLATLPNEMEARLLVDRLEEEGIRSMIKPRGAGYALAGPLSFIPHSVYVLEEHLERARQIADGGSDASAEA